jgi:methionyl-tRNA formyltransferase
MLDTIILLTGQVEYPFLASALRDHGPQLTLRQVVTSADVAALAPQVLRRARLVAFATDVVVTPDILQQLGYGAYNFHTGPPDFPGWRPAHFAIYQRAKEFGVTAHVMVEKVDAGPIVGVERFPVADRITVQELEQLTYARLARLFRQLAKPLATQSEPLPELAERWSGKKSTRRALAAMCGIPLDLSKDELNRRLEEISSPTWLLAVSVAPQRREHPFISRRCRRSGPG